MCRSDLLYYDSCYSTRFAFSTSLVQSRAILRHMAATMAAAGACSDPAISLHRRTLDDDLERFPSGASFLTVCFWPQNRQGFTLAASTPGTADLAADSEGTIRPFFRNLALSVPIRLSLATKAA